MTHSLTKPFSAQYPKKYCEIDRESSCCGTYYDEHIKRGVKPSVLTLERSDKHPRGYFTVLLNRGHRDGG